MNTILPENLEVYDSTGMPVCWFCVGGPERTFVSDSGDIRDLVGNAPAGIRVGGTSWVDGPEGPVLATNTTANCTANLGKVGNLPGDYTLIFSATLVNAPGGGIVMSKGQLNASGFFINAGSDGTMFYWISHSGYNSRASTQPGVCDGVRRRYAVVGSSITGVSLYVDGANKTDFPVAGSLIHPDPTSEDLLVGNYSGGGYEVIIPDFGNFQIYDYAMSPEQVARDVADPYWRLRRPAL